MTRRSLLQSLFVLLATAWAEAAAAVSTLIGTGSPGYSDQEVNNPYGVIFGPDDAEPLLGVTALESAGITVDPASRALKKLPAIRLK